MSDFAIFRIIRTLWLILSPRRRRHFCLLIAALFVSSLFDMTSVLLIFGFVGGLQVDADGQRHGKLIAVIEQFYNQRLSDEQFIYFGGGFVLFMLLFKNVLSASAEFALNRFFMKLNQGVSEELLRGYLRAPLEQVAAQGGRSPAQTIPQVFETFSGAFRNLSRILVDGITLCLVAVLLWFIDPWMTTFAAGLYGILGLAMHLGLQNTLVAMGREERETTSRLNEHLNDGFEGIVDIRLRDARPLVQRGYRQALARTAVLRRRTAAIERLPRASNEMLLAILLVGSVVLMPLLDRPLESALASLGVFAFIGLRMSGAITRLNKAFQRLKKQERKFDDCYRAVLKMAPQAFSEAGLSDDYLAQESPLPKGRDGRLHDAIRLKEATFLYPEGKRPAIDGVSLEIKRGTFVAFCGPSGGGKSTLALLLMGLYRPQSGTVMCDDWDVFQHIRAWHKNIGYVGQDLYLPARSVRANVAFAVPQEEVDDARVWECLRLANADEFVRGLSKELDFVIQRSGRNLSGGQRQRILIARALYNDPDVLVFDEATAALDNITEQGITESLRGLSGHKTVICIAHRLTTIRDAHVIYFVDKGRIAACGSYDQLLESSEAFRCLAANIKSKKSKKKRPAAPSKAI